MRKSGKVSDGQKSSKSVTCFICEEKMQRVFAKRSNDYLRCTNCGLILIDPLPTAADLREFYERDYSEEAGAGRLLAAQEEMARSTARYRLELIRKYAKGTKWLDVGCSTGLFLEEACQAGLDAEGIDISTVAVDEARRKGLKAYASTLDSFASPVTYDVVTGFDLIEHLLNPVDFLNLVHRILQPDGIVALTTPDTGSLICRLMGPAWWYYIPLVHLIHFNRSNLTQLLGQVGFEVLQISSARKSVTYDYGLEVLRRGNPTIHRIWKAFGSFIPRTWHNRIFSIPIGEMLVVARRTQEQT